MLSLISFENTFMNTAASLAIMVRNLRIHSVDKRDDTFTDAFVSMVGVLRGFYTDFKLAFCILNLVWFCTRPSAARVVAIHLWSRRMFT